MRIDEAESVTRRVAAGHRNILISEPYLAEMGIPYLPLVWGILKTYWEQEGPNDPRATWLAPLQRMGEVEQALRPYEGMRLDLLGLSCYAWNWRLQCLIAREVKARHPHCLVVAGGPEPDCRDPRFFAEHPYLDAVAVGDGEITFTQIVSRMLAMKPDSLDEPDLSDIPGLYLPGGVDRTPVSTGPAEVPTVFRHSPYLAQRDYYETLIRAHDGNVIAVWESSRGCPYRCNYCDWGSSTRSRLRLFDQDRIDAEIDWFGQNRVGFVMIADANFGIVARDLATAERFARANARSGRPCYVSYNTAKNNSERTIAIARTFLKSGLASAHILSIQHTDPGVLAAAERRNISMSEQIAVVRELLSESVPIYVQLILGIPGDRYDTWKRCFSDLMEWGIHSYYWVFPYNLLPNAPANAPEFRKRWEIETLDRYVLTNHGMRPRGAFDPVTEAPSTLIVSTRSFSRDDWVRMYTYASCVKALHNCAVTRAIAVYLRFTHDVPYSAFYDQVIEDFLPRNAPAAAWVGAMVAHYREYLAQEAAVDFMDVPGLPEFDQQLDPSRWLYTQICRDLDAFFDSLADFLLLAFPEATCLAEVISFQKNLIVLPDYDPERGAAFPVTRDWISYFVRAGDLMQYAPLPEPEPVGCATVVVDDTSWTDEGLTRPFDWGDGTEAQRWIRWINGVVLGRNSERRNNFTSLRLVTEPGGELAVAGRGDARGATL